MDVLPAELLAKRDQLLERLRRYRGCAVAFSGGLDSTVLAQAAQLALGPQAVAVTGHSASLAAGELEQCRELAARIGIRHEVLETQELANPQYQKNQADRCYHCKSDLFGRVWELARKLRLEVVVDGSNSDDLSEYRPGLKAARDLEVQSPLAEGGWSKAEIRQLAKAWGLPSWDKPATPCLSSRIAYGEEVTARRLAMVDQAEQFLRGFGLQPLRVRYHKGDLARIEVPAECLAKFLDAEFRRQLLASFKAAGFKYIALDLEGFRSGSMNAVLPLLGT